MPKLSLVIAMLLVSTAVLPQTKKISKDPKLMIAEATGIWNVELSDDIVNDKDKVTAAQKFLKDLTKVSLEKVYKKTKELQNSELFVIKLIISDNYGLNVNFFNSFFSSDYKSYIYIDMNDDVENTTDSILALLDYYKAVTSKMRLVGDDDGPEVPDSYNMVFYFHDINIELLKFNQTWTDEQAIVIRNYLFNDPLDKKDGAREALKEIFEDVTTSCEERLSKINVFLKKKGLNEGLLKLYVGLRIDDCIKMNFIGAIISGYDDQKYSKLGFKDEDKVVKAFEYRMLSSAFPLLVNTLLKDKYTEIDIDFNNTFKPWYDKSESTLHLTSYDIFYLDSKITVK